MARGKGQKLPHRGQKALRGKPLAYEELKRDATFSLTPKAIAGIDELAARFNCPSRSELIERLGRGVFSLAEGPLKLREEELKVVAKELASLLGIPAN